MNEDWSLAKVKWNCRRGMIELDVILLAFVDQQFLSLEPKIQREFTALLSQEDPDLYAWIMGYGTAPESFAGIISIMKTFIDNRLDA
ncbi:MAG: succinate dehydrogenase assembly factor 2 [Pseudomonadota bacterium]